MKTQFPKHQSHSASAGDFPAQCQNHRGLLSSRRSRTCPGHFCQDWQSLQWPGISDPAIIGPGTDPDGDGNTNLIEWALGLDPHLPDIAPFRIVPDGQQWKLTYQRPANRSGITYLVEVSPDRRIGSGTSAGVTQTRTAIGAVETWQATCAQQTARPFFFRLKVQIS